MAEQDFVPIIEPVKENLRPLIKTLDALCEVDARAIIIVNPQHGDHSDDGTEISELIADAYTEQDNLLIGILLVEDMTADDAISLCDHHADRGIALVHSGFSEAKQFAEMISDYANIHASIFVEGYCGKLYQRHFVVHQHRVLIRDGFQRRRGRDHPDAPEFFSDLHATFDMEGMQGFGDYLIVGDEYSEVGGPAYTIVIHLTYIDANNDDTMNIQHFKSDRQDTPKDPAGKFAEALTKLVDTLNSPNNKLIETSAITEFRDLHESGHYPGLGYLKKLSMKHHIETLAAYCSEPEPTR